MANLLKMLNKATSAEPGVPLALPPGIDMATFNKFIAAATDVVSAQNISVISATGQLGQTDYLDPAEAHDMFHLVGREHFGPGAGC
jgi:hypothetical protein